jgi:general secretion pathway protein G
VPERPARQLGFTLIEIALAVTLVGILSTLAYQSYRGQMERLRENQAVTDINTLSLQLQRWQTTTFSFPESLADAGLDGQLDPWGNPYVYLNVATADKNDVRKDKNLHPLNTDFDFYSMGPDGATKVPLTAQVSRDDIIRANNGSFVGRAEEY